MLDFSMDCRQKTFIFVVLTAFISNFTYYNLYYRKLKVITRKKYVLHFFIRPLAFSLDTREYELHVQESLQKNLEVV